MSETPKRLVRAFALCALLAIPALLGLMWLDHTRETTLPTPSGPFAVGRTTYVWSDAAQEELMAPQPGAQRELLAWIWYPAASPKPSQKPDDYLPAPWRAAIEQQWGALDVNFLTRDLSRVRAHGIRDAGLSPQQKSYPVVFMRGGLAANVTSYTSLAEDLASHGYVVVGFDAPYRSSVVVFPDGRVIEITRQNNADLVSGVDEEVLANDLVRAWSSDMGFALDELERLNTSDPSGRFLGRLDLQRVGAFGHSLGGATALQFCHDDPRCKACIDVDGAPFGSVIQEGLSQPVMFLLSDHAGEPDAETRPVKANIQSIYDRQSSDRRLEIMIRGANHFEFSDDGAMLRSPPVMGVLHAMGIVRLDGRRQIAVTEHFIRTFFDVYLNGAPAAELEDWTGYPEVEEVR